MPLKETTCLDDSSAGGGATNSTPSGTDTSTGSSANAVDDSLDRDGKARVVRIPRRVVEEAIGGKLPGTSVHLPVKVAWPELQLTESQILENAVAMVEGKQEPHKDHSIFVVEIPRISADRELDALKAFDAQD